MVSFDKSRNTQVKRVETTSIEYDSAKYSYSYFGVEIIWEENDWWFFLVIYKQNDKAEQQYKIPLHYDTLTHQLSFRNINKKVDHHTEASGSSMTPKHHKENQLLSLKHSCWLSRNKHLHLI